MQKMLVNNNMPKGKNSEILVINHIKASFKEKWLKVSNLEQPSNIKWENSFFSKRKRSCRKLFVILFTFMIVCISKLKL